MKSWPAVPVNLSSLDVPIHGLPLLQLIIAAETSAIVAKINTPTPTPIMPNIKTIDRLQNLNMLILNKERSL
jgi:hypothetical protein